MAIRDVVTMGYGNGTFSPGVSKIPTLGYGIGEASVYQSLWIDTEFLFVPGATIQDVFTSGESGYVSSTPSNARLMESGDVRITEEGEFRVTED